jgi:hypothetical protein
VTVLAEGRRSVGRRCGKGVGDGLARLVDGRVSALSGVGSAVGEKETVEQVDRRRRVAIDGFCSCRERVRSHSM